MKVRAISFLHLLIPFKGKFEHGLKARSGSDTILVKLETESGSTGWGEILARSYVTGETTDSIMSQSSDALAQRMLGREFLDQSSLISWLDAELLASPEHLALLGGVELALWQCLMQEHSINLAALLGPVRQSSSGNCVTIGFDAALEDLRARAIDARFKRASTVKLKVGLGVEADIERMQALSSHLGARTPLRMDGNGTFSPDTAAALLQGCRDLPLASFEQPFAPDQAHLEANLKALHRDSNVPLMADESVCSLADAERWAASGAYQLFNVRVGKHGGLLGSRRVRDCARRYGLGLVAGSMVGESGVLTHASTALLARSEDIPYVEGLGQNRRWLTIDPVITCSELADNLSRFHYRESDCGPLVQSVRDFH